MKIKQKPLALKQRIEKITLTGQTAFCLDQYAQYYAFVYHEQIPLSELIVEMLKALMQSDREFSKWVNAQKNKPSAYPENKPPLTVKTPKNCREKTASCTM